MDAPDESGGGEGWRREEDGKRCLQKRRFAMFDVFVFLQTTKIIRNIQKGRNTITLNYRCEVKCRFRHSEDLQPQSKRERERE